MTSPSPLFVAPYSKAFSASGLELAARCDRAHWLKYHDQIEDEPEVEWETIQDYVYDTDFKVWLDPTQDRLGFLFPEQAPNMSCTNRQRSLALGKAVHAAVERYFGGGELGQSFPDQVALSGLHFFPHPSECDVAQIEEACIYRGIPGTPDLVVRSDGRLILIDHKTCRDFVLTTRDGQKIECQKSEATLRKDRQVCRYAAGVMREFGVVEIECRWVYYKTGGKKREARCTAFTLTLAEAEAVVDGMVADAIRLNERFEDDTLTADDIPANTLRCDDFGGCGFRKNGACKAQKSKASVKSYKPPRDQKVRLPIMSKPDTSNEAFEKFCADNGIDITPAAMPFQEKLKLRREWMADLAKAADTTEPEAAAAEPQPEPEPAKATAPETKPVATPAAKPPKAATAPKTAPATPPADVQQNTPLGVPSDLTVEILVSSNIGGIVLRFPAPASIRNTAGKLVEGLLAQ